MATVAELTIRLVCLLFDQEEKWLLNEISWMLSRRLSGKVPSFPVRHFTLSTIRRHPGRGGVDTVAFVMIYVTNACDFSRASRAYPSLSPVQLARK